MTDFDTIRLETDDDGIAVVTIARPKRLNALDADVLSELFEAANTLRNDEALRAAIFTGEGRAFVAGADIAAMNEMSAEDAAEFGRHGHKTMKAIAELPVPTLAAINGFALGGGLELALSCDLIYAAEAARVGLPEVGLGIIPGFGGTQRLGRRVGWQQARRLVFTGETLSAEQALQIGLAIEVVPEDEDVVERTFEVARSIAANGPVAVRRAKEAMRRGSELSLEEAIEIEIRAFGGLWDTADRSEGMQAFLEKRPPEFQGE